jgi:hypothetical protein
MWSQVGNLLFSSVLALVGCANAHRGKGTFANTLKGKMDCAMNAVEGYIRLEPLTTALSYTPLGHMDLS